MNKIYTLPEIRSLLTPVFACYGVRCAVLFSSHAKGGTTEHSDTDILSMQIGEMAKTVLSNGAKVQIPSTPWQLLYGMRNRIIHGYANVHIQILWVIATEDIPKLNAVLNESFDRASELLGYSEMWRPTFADYYLTTVLRNRQKPAESLHRKDSASLSICSEICAGLLKALRIQGLYFVCQKTPTLKAAGSNPVGRTIKVKQFGYSELNA